MTKDQINALARPARRVSESLSTDELVAAVRRYALDHYNDGGWDVIVECWEDAEIAEEIGKARTLKGAIKKIGWIVGVYAEREADARNSAF